MSSCRLLLFVVLVALLGVSGLTPVVAAEGAEKGTNWGLGIGIPYGIIGVNLESGAQTRLTAGVGVVPGNLGWNVGLKHYFTASAEGEGRMSASVYWGVNTLIDTGSDWDTEEGLSVGLGWTSGHFDIGLILPISSTDVAGAEEVGPPIKLYVGYRFGETRSAPRAQIPTARPVGGEAFIVSPAAGASVPVGTEVEVRVEAGPVEAISYVDFYADGRLIGSGKKETPTSVKWPTSSVEPGTHTLMAEVRFRSGRITRTAPVQVQVTPRF